MHRVSFRQGPPCVLFVDAWRSIVRYLAPSRIGIGVTRFNEMINPTESSRFLLKLSSVRDESVVLLQLPQRFTTRPRESCSLKDFRQFSSPFQHPRFANWHAFNYRLVAWNVVTRANDCLLSSAMFLFSLFTARLFLLLPIKWRKIQSRIRWRQFSETGTWHFWKIINW